MNINRKIDTWSKTREARRHLYFTHVRDQSHISMLLHRTHTEELIGRDWLGHEESEMNTRWETKSRDMVKITGTPTGNPQVSIYISCSFFHRWVVRRTNHVELSKKGIDQYVQIRNKKINSVFHSHRIPPLSPPMENVKYNLFCHCQVAWGSFAANI